MYNLSGNTITLQFLTSYPHFGTTELRNCFTSHTVINSTHLLLHVQYYTRPPRYDNMLALVEIANQNINIVQRIIMPFLYPTRQVQITGNKVPSLSAK